MDLLPLFFQCPERSPSSSIKNSLILQKSTDGRGSCFSPVFRHRTNPPSVKMDHPGTVLHPLFYLFTYDPLIEAPTPVRRGVTHKLDPVPPTCPQAVRPLPAKSVVSVVHVWSLQLANPRKPLPVPVLRPSLLHSCNHSALPSVFRSTGRRRSVPLHFHPVRPDPTDPPVLPRTKPWDPYLSSQVSLWFLPPCKRSKVLRH